MAEKLDQQFSKLDVNKKSSGRYASSSSLSGDYFLQMLRDKKTEMYVKFAKVMVICQGPYTKDRVAMQNRVKEIFKTSSRILSDDTYKLEFKTECSADSTDEFYDYLKEEVKIALESGYNLIYIDSTMSNLKQNEYYISVARKMQYTVLVMPPVVTAKYFGIPWPKGSQASSFYKVSSTSRIEAPNMFQHLFCAWFLHDIDTEELRNECALYANDLFEDIPEFSTWFSKLGDKDFFAKYFGLTKEDVKKENMILREDLGFCPVKVFSNEFSMKEYFEKPRVREHYGRMSKLHIIGFVISPHMVAARVKLTHNQLDLWEIEDNVSEDLSGSEGILHPTQLYRSIKEIPFQKPDVKRICSKSNSTIVNGDNLYEPEKLILPHYKSRTAHIVLGTAPTASHADIDFGVAFAVKRENLALRKDDVDTDIIDIGKSRVRRIGKYWLIYLKDTIIVNGFFSSCVKPKIFDIPVQTEKKLNI